MALRRYQNGYLVVRGKGSHKKWVARWRQDIVRTDGTVERRNRSQVLGRVEDISSREARRLLASLLKDGEQVQKEQAAMTFGEFARKWEDTVLPTYRSSTRYFYRNILHDHLLPHFKAHRLCDLQTADVQVFMNLKRGTILTLPPAPYPRNSQSNVRHCQTVGLCEIESRARDSASPEQKRSAKDHIPTIPSHENPGATRGTAPNHGLARSGHGNASFRAVWFEVARRRLRAPAVVYPAHLLSRRIRNA